MAAIKKVTVDQKYVNEILKGLLEAGNSIREGQLIIHFSRMHPELTEQQCLEIFRDLEGNNLVEIVPYSTKIFRVTAQGKAFLNK